MEPSEIFDDLRDQLKQVEAAGNSQIDVGVLRRYLDALQADAGSTLESRRLAHDGRLAEFAAQNASSLAHYQATVATQLEAFKSTLEAGKSAAQALLVINGGAAVALFGVFANLSGKPESAPFALLLVSALVYFGFGVLSAALCFGARYLSQAIYEHVEGEKSRAEFWGDRVRELSIAFALVGYVTFFLGIMQSSTAVTKAFTPKSAQVAAPVATPAKPESSEGPAK